MNAIEQWLASQGFGSISEYAGAVNPWSDPIFGSLDLQHGMEQSAPTQGSGTGLDWMDWGSVPGYEAFYRAPQLAGTENEYGAGIDRAAFDRYLADNGYSLQRGVANISDDVRWLQDAQGNLVGTPTFAKNTSASDLNMMLAIIAAGGAAYASGLGSGAAGGAAGAAGADGAALGGGLSSAEAAALYGDLGYGAGMTGAETAAFDAALGAGGGAAGGLVDSSIVGGEFNPSGISSPSFGAGADFAAVSPANGGGMDWSSLLTNPNLWGNVINAGVGIWGANKAAGAQQDASRDANALMWQMYQQQRADQQPYMQSGYGALDKINALLADPSSIKNDPSYGFQFDEGLDALNSGAAARGMSQSGAVDKARIQYGQNYAGTKLGESFNRLASVAGLGQTATNNASNAAGTYGQQAGGNMLGAGNARASGYMGSSNAIGNALGQGLNTWNTNNVLKQFGYGGWGG